MEWVSKSGLLIVKLYLLQYFDVRKRTQPVKSRIDQTLVEGDVYRVPLYRKP